VAYLVPQIPPGAVANSINDVCVDEKRTIYAVDRLKGGLYTMELTIKCGCVPSKPDCQHQNARCGEDWTA